MQNNLGYAKINAEWLNKKINLHYNGNQKAFAKDNRNAFKYSMITKHTTSETITERFKNHYYLFFLCLENGLI
tara:strand:+ start:933 stop:1151 length:219 start_codon:yes stop_codon:yes gene_type:complete